MRRKIIFESVFDRYESEGFDYPLEERLFDDYDYKNDSISYEGSYDHGHPISLKKLKEIIKTLEEAGAKWISMDYHEDHGSYLFQGLKIDSKTEDDLTKEEKEQVKSQIEKKEFLLKVRQEYIKNLKEEIRELKEKLI